MTPLANRECGRCQGEGGMETALGTTLPAAQNSTSLALNVSHTPGSRAGELSEHQQYVIGLFLSCVYTIFLFPIGFLGNILILVVNIRFREKMTIPDLYFINLAAADLILVADSLIEVFNLDQQYYDVAVLCTFMSLFLQVNMYSSVFFLTWMSFDRYVALARAMRGGLLRTMRHARLSCGLIWMASVSATLVPFAAVHLQRRGEACLCFADAKEVQWLEVTLGFLVPFAIIGLCYSLVVRVLVRAHRHRSLRPRRQKALRMILAVVLVFFTCWLPENVFISVHLLQRAPPGATPCKQSFRHAHPLTGHIVNLAAFSNSCLNPLIYSFLGETFRDKLRLYLEQKPGVSALNRLCHTALKAVVPDSTERPSRRLGNTTACSRESAQLPAGDGAWFTVQQSPEGGPAPDTPEWHSRIGSPSTASHRAHTHDSPHAIAHMPQPLCHSHSLPCVPYSLADDV